MARSWRGQEVDDLDAFPANAGPLSEWALTAVGRPKWIALLPDSEFGPWAFIRPPAYLETRPRTPTGLARSVGAMPCLPQGTLREFMEALVGRDASRKTKRGRPGLAMEEPETVKLAAWLADVRDIGDAEIARQLRFVAPDVADRVIPLYTRRRVRRYVRAGRSLLRHEGVLPWVLWEDGDAPPWWAATPLFGTALEYWYRFYVEQHRDEFPLIREYVRKVVRRRQAMATDPEAAFRRALDGRPPA